MKNSIIYVLAAIMLACSGNTQKSKQIKSEVISIDSTLIKPYLKLLNEAPESDKKYFRDVIYTIEHFQNRSFDTTVLVYGLIDSDNKIDTILSHVFVNHDTVLVQSTWKRNGEILWRHELKDPDLEFDADPIFVPIKSYVKFTIGYKYAIPRLIKKSVLTEIGSAIKFGQDNLKELGYSNQDSVFRQYYLDFHGSIILFDNPLVNPGYIWYDPIKKFVLIWVG